MVNSDDEPKSAFERRSKALFDESVEQLNGNLRSRLNQARHAALAQAQGSRTRRFWVPAAGLTAAAVVAAVLVTAFISGERGIYGATRSRA